MKKLVFIISYILFSSSLIFFPQLLNQGFPVVEVILSLLFGSIPGIVLFLLIRKTEFPKGAVLVSILFFCCSLINIILSTLKINNESQVFYDIFSFLLISEIVLAGVITSYCNLKENGRISVKNISFSFSMYAVLIPYVIFVMLFIGGFGILG